MTKEILDAAKEALPDEFNLDDLFERLIFIEDIKAARKEIADGKGIPLEEVKEIIKGWRK